MLSARSVSGRAREGGRAMSNPLEAAEEQRSGIYHAYARTPRRGRRAADLFTRPAASGGQQPIWRAS